MSKTKDYLNYRCRDCEYLTNVFGDEIDKDNVMGGCFIDGHLTTTDTVACKKLEKREKI